MIKFYFWIRKILNKDENLILIYTDENITVEIPAHKKAFTFVNYGAGNITYTPQNRD